MTVSIERCREVLGEEGIGKSDEELQRIAQHADALARFFYDEIQEAWRKDPESVRAIVRARRERSTASMNSVQTNDAAN